MSSPIYWLNRDSRLFLERGYLQEGVTPEQRIREIAERAQAILGMDGYADRFEDYMRRGWFSLSSPVWSNFGLPRGLPISCNGSYIDDTRESIFGKHAEVAMMTAFGAGTSAYFGALRARGAPIKGNGKSSGPVHFMELFDLLMDVVSQGNVRRGSFAAYLPIDHPDIEEFIQIGSEGSKIKKVFTGVCISDAWMESMIAGDKAKRSVWAKVIKRRFEHGQPYLFFTDAANRGAPQVYRDKGMTIHASNLCTEIMEPTTLDESFVCCLASLNLLHWDEWKDTDAVETLTQFLDATMTEYIEKTAGIAFMEDAHRFARRHRALGVGVLGWHSLLQSRMIPFESMEAKLLNTAIHRAIRDKTRAASQQMAALFGEPEVLKGYGMRNTTTMAIAPTTSSSFILGQVSQGIEPLNSNYYLKDNAKGKFAYRNPHLKTVLKAHDRDNETTWKSILVKGGSVQHLTFLTDNEREVFKTFGEISQKEIVIQAAARQPFIDQGQSLNLMIPPNTPPRQVSELHIEAWRMGLKSLYYMRSGNPAQELARDIMACKSCQA